MKILICEDDLSTLAIIKHILSKYSSLELIIARSGSQAHRFINKNYYDLILTTISMPYHSGLELIKYVRKVKKSAVPIIVLSIEGYEEAVLLAFRLGANESIVKPFNPAVLIAQIHKYLKLEKH